VRLRAKFIETQTSAEGVRLLLEFGPEFLIATLPVAAGAPKIAPRRGAEIEMTGVLQLDHETRGARGAVVPSSARLLLRDPSDIRVIRQGPWWNRQRLWAALLIAASFTALSATWSAHLWRSARRQALALAETQHAQRTLDIQQESTLRERDRIAGELHDGIQQLLTGLCFHLEAAEGPSGDPRPHIVNARSIVARIRDEFRRCLWELQHIDRDTVDPAHSLRRIVALQHLCSDTHVDVTVEGVTGPVPSPVMASLSLVTREAIHNAVRHGAAKRVAIGLRGDAEGLVLDISDDGCGFAPAALDAMPDSHRGLRNIRQRIAALGGTLAIDSQPGHGTRLTAHIPAAALATDRAPTEHPENLPAT
jgi:signal transduction histidine kinase